MRYIAVVLSVYFGIAHAQTRMTVLPLDPSISGVSVFGPNDPSFQAFFNSKVQPDELPAFQPIVPYSVVVRNDSAKPVLGFYLQFAVLDSNGHPFYMGQRRGYRVGDVALAPGAETWIAIDGVYSAMFDAVPGSKWRIAFTAGTGSFPAERPPAYYSSARSVTVSLDSVLSADGTLSGPDRVGTATTFAAWLRGDMALAQTVMGFKSDSVGLEQYLDSQAELRPRPDQEFREILRRAIELRGTLKRKGLDATLAQASSLYSAASSVNLHRAN
jgi:hypothetical protein